MTKGRKLLQSNLFCGAWLKTSRIRLKKERWRGKTFTWRFKILYYWYFRCSYSEVLSRGKSQTEWALFWQIAKFTGGENSSREENIVPLCENKSEAVAVWKDQSWGVEIIWGGCVAWCCFVGEYNKEVTFSIWLLSQWLRCNNVVFQICKQKDIYAPNAVDSPTGEFIYPPLSCCKPHFPRWNSNYDDWQHSVTF